MINLQLKLRFPLRVHDPQRYFKSEISQYSKNKLSVQYYETEALKNVAIITTAANNQFNNGNINYLEWTMLINQTTEIQSNYIEAIKQLNSSIIEINSLIKK